MANALKLPPMGLGTWQLSPEQAKFSTIKAVEIGYRFIDTAQAYKNEQGVGEGLQEIFQHTTIKRSDLIVATKVDVFNLKPKKVKPTVEISLQKLQLEYVDLLYVHWPAKFSGYQPEKTLKVFSDLVDEGKVKHIAVSNFSIALLEEALAVCPKPIVANQVEHHPLLQQTKLREYLHQKQIHLIAYSPLARGEIHGIPEIENLAKKYQTGAAQISLAWLMAHNAIPIPKATSEAHLRSNFTACQLKLEPADIEIINGIKIQKRLLNPPVVKPKKWD